MRKYALFFMIAALFLFSGCNLIQNLVSNNKPPASSNATSEPKPSSSAKPSPSVKPSPEEEGPPVQSAEGGGHLFGGSNAYSSSGETAPAAGNSAVQDAQLQAYNEQSISSTDDVVYTENASVRADYDGNGTKEILEIDFSYDYPKSDEMNFPVMITLTIGDSSKVYENTWNDGVAVGIADFDTSDAELDIYIISLGTDVSAFVQTYWYDGSDLDEYTWFDIIEDTAFWYDTQGYIYYRGQYEDAYGVMVGLNFYSGEVFTVE